MNENNLRADSTDIQVDEPFVEIWDLLLYKRWKRTGGGSDSDDESQSVDVTDQASFPLFKSTGNA